jgi:PTS system cellobiose-specific IIB component
MKILLLCNAGMSTSLLVKKMKVVAAERGIENIEIEARSALELRELIETYDVFLLGPQLAYKEKEISKTCMEYDKKFALIAPMIYGMVDGEKALDLALGL